MASGANTIPIGQLILKSDPGSSSTSSLLKPAYVSSAKSSRFSDKPNPDAAPKSFTLEKRPSREDDRERSRDRERDRKHDDRDDSRYSRSHDYRSSRNDEESRSSVKSSKLNTGTPEPASREGSAEPTKKKRRSRWAETTEARAFIPGMPTIIPANLSRDQERIYLLQLQIEDYSRKLRTGDLGIPANVEERSPSPEPIYNHEGKRLNTRELRTRRKLEDERHKLIQEMITVNPEYKAPADYKAPLAKFTDKVLIPQDDHPEINFVGLLIGPRGNTLKSLEKETGTKIIIRGKGSVKEGKIGKPNRDPLPGEDEPLHAYITGQSIEYVRGAVIKIRQILAEGIEVPEHQNDLRKQQLRELALLNGTLRDDLGPRCSNCGSTAHRTWNCPDKPNVTHTIICNRCNGVGHIAKDCKTDLTQVEANALPTANMDEEYLSLMAELGHGPPAGQKARGGPSGNSATSNGSATTNGDGAAKYGSVPPPSQSNASGPPPPAAPQQQQQQQQQPYGAALPPPPPPPPAQQGMQQGPAQHGGYPGQWGQAPPPPPMMHPGYHPTHHQPQHQQYHQPQGYNQGYGNMPPWMQQQPQQTPPPPPPPLVQYPLQATLQWQNLPPPPPPPPPS
ncbi:hypothetical protein RvY_03221 [Ramazzottius varieornatus]|uniref:Branchpoint-bridging protein n=1 Tax=Ramazzottius varieornatus TaxID=947166 RepID=A0A1D1UN55_RAMVA|nr:hypothetical protein RvY_03221 [Ramazzottius varieornatus]